MCRGIFISILYRGGFVHQFLISEPIGRPEDYTGKKSHGKIILLQIELNYKKNNIIFLCCYCTVMWLDVG